MHKLRVQMQEFGISRLILLEEHIRPVHRGIIVILLANKQQLILFTVYGLVNRKHTYYFRLRRGHAYYIINKSSCVGCYPRWCKLQQSTSQS